MQHDEIKDLVAAYVLGAVDPDERREIEAHIADCDECRRELASFESITDTMARAVPPVSLPAGFSERVVDAAVGEPSSTRRPSPWWRRLAIGLAAAFVVALVAMAGTIFEARNDAQRRRQIISLLASGEGIALSGEGEVIARIVPGDDGSRFAVVGLPSAPEGKTYQLWLMRGENCPSSELEGCELVSAGTFDTEDGAALIDVERDIDEWEDAAMTTEPDEGSDFPTTTPFADSL